MNGLIIKKLIINIKNPVVRNNILLDFLKDGYSYSSSAPEHIKVGNERYINWKGDRADKLRIMGHKEGKTQLYIYKRGYHEATVFVNVLPKIQPIKLSGVTDLKQGEESTLQITSGGGYYKLENYDKQMLSVSIDTENNTLSIFGKQHGKTELVMKDQYEQYVRIGVRVKDVSLKVRKTQISLNGGQEIENYIQEYYKGIKRPLKKNNDHISVWLEKNEENGYYYLRIKGESQGESIIQLEDYEGNIKTIKVQVSQGSSNNNEKYENELEEELEEEVDSMLEDILNTILNKNEIKINSSQNYILKQSDAKLIDELFIRMLSKMNGKSLDERIKVLNKINGIIRNKYKDAQGSLKIICKYIIHTAEGHIEILQKEKLSKGIHNPYETLLLADLHIYSKALEMKIKIGATNWGFDETHIYNIEGGILGYKSLNFWKEKGILDNNDIDKLKELSPKAEDIYKALLEAEIFSEQNGYYEEGFKDALQDYISGYLELLDPREWPGLILGVKEMLERVVSGNYDIDKLREMGEELYEIVSNLEELISGLDDKKKYYYKGYVHTTVSLMFVPIKIDKINKVKPKGQDNNVMSELIRLLKIYQAKKITDKFSDIRGVDDLMKIAKENQVTIGKGGGAITLYGSREGAIGIVKQLEKKGWNEVTTKEMKAKGLYKYESNDGKEGITLRNFDSSEGKGLYQGHKHEATIEILKFNAGKTSKEEIKFLLPK